MTIAVFGNTLRPTIITIINKLFYYFNDKGVSLLFDKELLTYYNHHSNEITFPCQIIENDNFQADLALSIGGDGTFLNTAARVGSKSIPILGINTGRLGFLADVSFDELEIALEAIINNRLSIEEHTLIKVKCSDNRLIEYPYALNDVSVQKQDSSSMVTINTYLNNEAIHSYHADGLIIATPTGSTAYSMSVGGPLMAPQSQSILLSPVASHSLTVRPLVIPDNWIIDLIVESRSGSYQLSMDGRTMVLEDHVWITIIRGEYTIKVAKQMNHTFFDTLKSKLMWGLDKRN